MRTEKQKEQLKKAQARAHKANTGRKLSDETKRKIGDANRNRVWFMCDFCKESWATTPSAYAKKKRHFCSTKCYADYRRLIMPKEEQQRYGSGEPIEVKIAKLKCRRAFNNYLRDKKVERQPCEVCRNPKSEGHHDDYSKPLSVKWLCFVHHRQLHGQLIHQHPHLLEKE